MNEESKRPNIDPELEARIIALVLGEASDFEDQQLNKLIEFRPDLAAFKSEMQRVHGLLTDVGATEFQAPVDDWRLPSEKRNAVLAVIRGEATVQQAASNVHDATASGHVETSNSSGMSSGVSSAVARRWNWNPAFVAAALCLAAFMGLIFLPVVQSPRESSRRIATVANEESHISQVEFTTRAGAAFSTKTGERLSADADVLESMQEELETGRSANSHSALSSLSQIRGLWTFGEAGSENFSSGFESVLNQNSVGGVDAPTSVSSLGSVTVTPKVSGSAATPGSTSPAIVYLSDGALSATSSGGIDLPELVADSGSDWSLNGQLSSPEDALLERYERLQSSRDLYFAEGLTLRDGGYPYGEQGKRIFRQPVEGKDGDALLGADVLPSADVLLGADVLPGESRRSGEFGGGGGGRKGKSSNKTGQQRLGRDLDLGFQNYPGSNDFFADSMPPVSEPAGVDFGLSILGIQGVAPAPAWQQMNGGKAGPAEDSSSNGIPVGDRIGGGVLIAGQAGQASQEAESDQLSIGGVFLSDRSVKDSGSDKDSRRNFSEWDEQRGDENTEAAAPNGDKAIEGTGDDDGRKIDKLEGRFSISRQGQRDETQNLRELLSPLTGTELQTDAKKEGDQSSKPISGLWGGTAFDKGAFSDKNQELEAIGGFNPRQSELSLIDSDRIDKSLNMPVLNHGDGQPSDGQPSGGQLGAAIGNDLKSPRSKRRELPEERTLELFESTIVDLEDLQQDQLRRNSISSPEMPFADRSYAERYHLNDTETEELELALGINEAGLNKTRETISSKSNKEVFGIAGEEEKEAVDLTKQQGSMVVLDSLPSKSPSLFQSESAAKAAAKKTMPNPVSSGKQGTTQRAWRQLRHDTDGKLPARENQKGLFFRKQQLQLGLSAENLNESTTKENAFSTFSLHVSDVSFKLAFAALVNGEWPDASKIRIEEFVNAFDYGDPSPSSSEKVACQVEQSIHPFLQQRNLLRVAMKTGVAGRASSTPLRLTFLLDNSGSMERPDRQQTIRRAFQLLTEQLNPTDHVTLISFARQPRLLADSVNGGDAKKLVKVIETLPSEGGTNIEAALQLAYEKAKEHQTSGAQNRIILLTDGAVNLGNANPDSLSHMVASMRNSGIAFDAAGIVADGLNDEVLEALTRKGDGRYYLLDSEESADNDFAKQIAGALRPSAKNVKVQIEFNPKRVGRYKLLGFEKHILKKQDFRNDKIDAAEMAAAEAGVALYQFEAMPDGEGDVGSVSVRFQDLSTGQMVENKWPIPYEANAPRIDQSAESVRIAAAAALLAAKLRGEPLGESVNLKALSALIDGLPEANRNNERIQMLRMMIQKARQLAGE